MSTGPDSATTAATSLSPPRLQTASTIDAEQLDAFLRRNFSPAKAHFLRLHGEWWHHGSDNRLVLTVNHEIAGYCALIPITCAVAGEEVEAVWWVDLVIAREYRGLGLQRYFDREVRERAQLLLGVPNALAAAIHRKHGWGVREDLATLLLPLRPGQLRPLQRTRGVRGRILRGGAFLLSPLALLWRRWLRCYQPRSARLLEALDPQLLSHIAERYPLPSSVHTRRDAHHFDWRYGQLPWPQQLRCYVAGPRAQPTWALIARVVPQADGPGMLRILELFGDPAQSADLRDVVRLATRDAAAQGLAQITVLAGPVLAKQLWPLGFLVRTRSRFCWLSAQPQLMARVAAAEPAWGLGDSDNDELC